MNRKTVRRCLDENLSGLYVTERKHRMMMREITAGGNAMKIGEIMAQDREITLNDGKKTVVLTVANMGDRPVQVGSHYHFFEVNKCLSFDREKAYGYHLDIPSGTSVRFEPGEEKSVQLTELGGTKRVFGLNDLTCAQTAEATKQAALEKAAEKGFIR